MPVVAAVAAAVFAAAGLWVLWSIGNGLAACKACRDVACAGSRDDGFCEEVWYSASALPEVVAVAVAVSDDGDCDCDIQKLIDDI